MTAVCRCFRREVEISSAVVHRVGVVYLTAHEMQMQMRDTNLLN